MFLQVGMHAKMTNKSLRFIGLYTIPKEKYKAQDTNISLNDSSHWSNGQNCAILNHLTHHGKQNVNKTSESEKGKKLLQK